MKDKLRWKIAFGLVVLVVISYLDRVNFAIAVPLLMKEIGLDAAQLGIIMSAFTFGYMLLKFQAGFIVARFSASRVLSFILFFWSIMTILTGFAGSFAALLIIRVIFGMCEGPMLPANSMITNHWMLPKERATTSGIWMAAIPVGVIIGNILSGYIVTQLGWRAVFYIFGVLGIPLAYFLYRFLTDRPEDHKKISKTELDLILGAIRQHEGTAVAAASGSSFKQLMLNPWLLVLGLIYFAAAAVFWANVNWLPTYFVKARGFSLLQAGFLASLPWIGAVVGPPLIGMISDRSKIKLHSLWLACCLFLTVPFISLAVIVSDIKLCLICFALSSLFTYGTTGLLWALPGEIFDRADVAKAAGFMLGFGSLSGVIAPSLVGYVLKYTNSFNIAYYVFAAVSFVAACLALVLMKREKEIRRQKSGAAKSAA